MLRPSSTTPHHDYTPITELPAAPLTPDQLSRFAHRYGYAHQLAQGQRVLEVACGAGGGLELLRQSASSMIGLDRTASVLAHARHATTVPLVQGDAQELPFADGHFDLILLFEAIYYLPDYRRFLAECHRLLVAGGTLLIGQSNPDWPNFVPGALTTHYPNLPELVAALQGAGFGSVQCSGILPITASGPRQRLVNWVRRWVLASGILPLLRPLRPMLQRMSYGELRPLPTVIDAPWVATWQAEVMQRLIAPDQRDTVHRVIYVEATR
jgi:SAM-dependent methyltransferase